MMKDCFDAVIDVRSLLNVPALTGAISGAIWPFIRPNNSNKVDVVIGVLTLSMNSFRMV
jgi:hypothetical protein